MKLALIGLPDAGKETLFSVLSGKSVDEGESRTISEKAVVADNRLDKLVERYKSKKKTPADYELVLIPSLDREGQNGGCFEGLTKMDVICCVASKGEKCAGDLRYIIDEMILSDLIIVEERLARAGDSDLLSRMRGHLEEGFSLRTFEFSSDEQKSLRDFPLLSVKPAIVISDTAPSDHSLLWQDARMPQQLSGLACKAAGLISFFTASDKEARAWLIPAGIPAPRAARSVHRDMEKGFIRAEVITYSDFEEGKRSTSAKGKDYIVGDGDILNFLFRV